MSSSTTSLDEKQQFIDAELKVNDGSQSPLPTPVSATPSKPKTKVSGIVITPIWIVLSSMVIIYNNYLYNTLDFKYPVFLVTFHLTFAAIGTRILQRTTNLLEGTKDIRLTKDMFVKSILPIGLLFSGSLILSNTAYLYLSVSYIQMLKVRVKLCNNCQDLHLNSTIGFHPGCDPSDPMDLPAPRAE